MTRWLDHRIARWLPWLPCSPGSLCASFNNVDHLCQQCGTTVEDGRPFCPQCRAPQIHVHVETADALVGEDFGPVGDFSPETAADSSAESPPRRSYESGETMDRRIAGRAALKAGVAGILIGMIPLLGVVLTGALAVYFYRRESKLRLPAALAARLGAAAAVVPFGISAFLFVIRIFVFHGQPEYIKALTQLAQGMGINAADPDFQAGIHNLFTPAWLVMIFLFGMLITVVLGLVGGALASLLQRSGNTRG